MDQPPSTTEASTHVEEISTKNLKNVWLNLLKIATSSNPNLQGGGCIFASVAKLVRICFESKCPPKHPTTTTTIVPLCRGCVRDDPALIWGLKPLIRLHTNHVVHLSVSIMQERKT